MENHDTPAAEENLLERDELEKLWACEDTIAHGVQHYLKVGEALTVIKAGRLYREDYPTFGAYCQEKWKLTDRHVRNLANAWEVALDLDPDPIGNADQLPANERQARELKQVPKDRRSEVWEAAIAEAGGVEHVCAHDVKTARERLLGTPEGDIVEDPYIRDGGGQDFEPEQVHDQEMVVVDAPDPANHAARIINKHGARYAAELIHELDRILTIKEAGSSS